MSHFARVHNIGRRIGWLVAIFLLGVTGLMGLYNGATEWADAITPLQKSVTGGVFLYGVLGVVGAVGLLLRKRWSFPVVLIWGVVITYVPGAAVMGYAPDGTWGAALAGSVAAGLIALAAVWATRANTRAQTTTRSETP